MTLKRSRSKTSTAVVAVRGQAVLQLAQQRAAVREPREVVVVRVVLRLLLGVEASLQLDEHGGDGLQGVDLRGVQACRPKCRKPRMPQVWSAMSKGTAAPPTRFTPVPASTRSRYSSGVPWGTGR